MESVRTAMIRTFCGTPTVTNELISVGRNGTHQPEAAASPSNLGLSRTRT